MHFPLVSRAESRSPVLLEAEIFFSAGRTLQGTRKHGTHQTGSLENHRLKSASVGDICYETNKSHLKIDAWKTSLSPFGARPIFRGQLVSFGRCVVCKKMFRPYWSILHPIGPKIS